jgi:hypothetical protein
MHLVRPIPASVSMPECTKHGPIVGALVRMAGADVSGIAQLPTAATAATNIDPITSAYRGEGRPNVSIRDHSDLFVYECMAN